MPAAAIVTVIIALVIAAALAYYFIRVILVLRAVNQSLSGITSGMRAIADQTAPLAELLTPVKTDLEELADALEAVAAQLSETDAVA